MKKLLIPISVGLLCTSFTIIRTLPLGQSSNRIAGISQSFITDSTLSNDVSSFVYDQTGLAVHGLSREAFNYAWRGYQYLLNHRLINKKTLLTICDFSQSSRQKRLYIIDTEKSEILLNTYVAHGKNTGGEYATQFSNKPESLQSSLGFYITAKTYTGEHGLSLRLNGVDPGFNDKAFERSIVIHGADYVDEARVRNGMYMGRSWGCPAVPSAESTKIINTIKDGSCLFIYHPTGNYLHRSKILND